MKECDLLYLSSLFFRGNMSIVESLLANKKGYITIKYNSNHHDKLKSKSH